MRPITRWITTVLAVLILLYSYHANLTGTGGKPGNINPACTTTVSAAPADCGQAGKLGENK